MAGSDQAGNPSQSTGAAPLSQEEAERLANQFTPLWEAGPEAAPGPGLPPAAVTAHPVIVPPAAAPPGSVATSQDAGEVVLPDSKTEYAPPRPLPAAQKTVLGLAPPTTIEVAGDRGPPPDLAQTAADARGISDEPGREDEAPASTNIDTIPPRSRQQSGGGRALVLGIVGGGLIVILVLAARSFFAGNSGATATVDARRTEAVPAVASAAPPAPTQVAPAEPPPEETAAEKPEETAEAPTEEPEPPVVAEKPRAAKASRATTSTRRATATSKVERPKARPEPKPARSTSPRPATGGAIVRDSPF